VTSTTTAPTTTTIPGPAPTDPPGDEVVIQVETLTPDGGGTIPVPPGTRRLVCNADCLKQIFSDAAPDVDSAEISAGGESIVVTRDDTEVRIPLDDGSDEVVVTLRDKNGNESGTLRATTVVDDGQGIYLWWWLLLILILVAIAIKVWRDRRASKRIAP
jgi:hypothetical protein